MGWTVLEAPEVIQYFRSEMDNGFLADGKNIPERQLIQLPGRLTLVGNTNLGPCVTCQPLAPRQQHSKPG
jgi:hypothetical protein